MAVAAPIPTSNWWVFLLEGIAAILIGLLLLTDPAATVVAISIFLASTGCSSACSSSCVCSSIAQCRGSGLC